MSAAQDTPASVPECSEPSTPAWASSLARSVASLERTIQSLREPSLTQGTSTDDVTRSKNPSRPRGRTVSRSPHSSRKRSRVISPVRDQPSGSESEVSRQQLEEETPSKAVHPVSFGRTTKPHKFFPTHPQFKDIVDIHRVRPDKRFSGQKAMQLKYPFAQDLAKEWSQSPSVDPPVSRLATKAVLSSSEGASIKHPTDRQIEQMARSAFEASSASLFPSFAATWVAKAMSHWAESLSSTALRADLPPGISHLATQIARAGDFVVSASLDAANCASQAAANAVTIRRSLWLRDWKADSGSKKSLTSLPYQGERLFGDKLDKIIADSTGGKSKFLPQQRTFRPFRNQQGRGRYFRFGSNWSNPSSAPPSVGRGQRKDRASQPSFKPSPTWRGRPRQQGSRGPRPNRSPPQ
ncbi:uncharacterized protein LOC143788534 [Ranitomeya variabilis]|uniref:uncharacterized protein LOC143788534 n=1 Tax=Ranitomeya variabilis TaxID=490064 RepID=UPI004055F702